MQETLRYVTQRLNSNGTARWYWQRRGHKVVRLPDDAVKRFEMATRLNDAADFGTGDIHPEGSIGWVIEKYKRSDGYGKLAQGTLKYYKRYLNDIYELGSTLPFSAFDRRAVIDFVNGYSGKSDPRHAAVVLGNLFNIAQYYRIVETNHAKGLNIASGQARVQFWFPEQIEAWLKAAELHPKGKAMITSFHLLHYTAQRPGDVLSMSWIRLDETGITLRQQKSKKLIKVPCHKTLREHLEIAKQEGDSNLIVSHAGKGLSYTAFNRAWREITEMANLHKVDCRDLSGFAELHEITEDELKKPQARDLRRTACIRMSEAGCSEKQISSISGHSIEATRHIMETYIPTTSTNSDEAIRKREQAGN